MALLKHYLDRCQLVRCDRLPTPCWLSHLAPSKDGYVYASVGGRDGQRVLLHRMAYEELVGTIPEGADLDHLCRNRACWSPEHVEPVTRRENLRRGETTVALHDANRCKRGHSLADAHIYGGKRQCRICANEARRARRALGRVA